MKRVLITGASSGIGLQLAQDYQQAGWQVIACGRNEQKLIKAINNDAIKCLCFDTNHAEHSDQQLRTIENIDLAILNAGDCEYIDNAKAFDTELFTRIIKTNLIGTANCIPAVTTKLNKGGTLAITSSACTFIPLPRAEAYGASKAAIDYLARTLAIDLAKHNINISLIRPGFVDTPLTQKNNFSMPFLTSLPKASQHIRKGLERNKREISFPSPFIIILKLLAALPYSLQYKLGISIAKTTGEKA